MACAEQGLDVDSKPTRKNILNKSRTLEKVQVDFCEKYKSISTCASAKPDQDLHILRTETEDW